MRRLSLVLVLLLSAACVRTKTDPVTGKTDVDVESPLKKGEDWKAKVNGQGTYGAVQGEAKAAVLEGKSTVTVMLTGGKAGASYPWMVHEGKCGSAGAPIGSAGAYPALTFSSEGKADATVQLPMALDESKDYHVLVHASSSDMATIVACGDLSDSA